MTETLRTFLKGCVDNGSHSIAMLSKKSGLSEMTVRRIIQGENSASFETAVALLKVTAQQSEMMTILRADFPDLSQTIEKIWGPAEIYSPQTNTDLNKALSTSLGCYIINLAACKGGIKRETIAKLYGKCGTDVLEKLLSNELLIENGEKIKTPTEDFAVSDFGTMLSQIRSLADLYNTKHKTHVATIQSDKLNSDGALAVQKAVIRCSTAIAEIRQDPKFHGDIALYFCAFANRFYDDDILREEASSENAPRRDE